MIQIKKTFLSFRYAIQGIRYCIRQENNFRVHVIACVAVIIAAFYAKLSRVEWCMILLAIALVLVSEIFNTAIERLVDIVSPEHHPKAGIIKDITAGAVLVASIVAVLIGVLVFCD